MDNSVNSNNTDVIIQKTDHWVSRFVIHYNLCPFAAPVWKKGRLHYHVSVARDTDALLNDFLTQLEQLRALPIAERETTLLIHPYVLEDFSDYYPFLGVLEGVIEAFQWQSQFQVASFHPDYCFAETAPQDVRNYTNRSPYPMLHLLRQDSLTRALLRYPDPGRIPEVNMALMQRLGLATLLEQTKDPHELK